MDGRDAGESGVCRHQRLSSCRVSRCGQDRVERAEARSFLEQAQSFAQVSFPGDQDAADLARDYIELLSPLDTAADIR
ncbi:MAG: hypothetical protein ACLP7J_13455 [Streptosporangiaceae bacterium]